MEGDFKVFDLQFRGARKQTPTNREEGALVPFHAPASPSVALPFTKPQQAVVRGGHGARVQSVQSEQNALSAQPPLCTELKDIEVRLCVVSFSLGVDLDVEALARDLPNVDHGNQKGMVTIRALQPPKWTAKVSNKGRVVVYSQFGDEASRLCAKRVARLVQKRHNPGVSFKRFSVQNVQLTARLPFHVDIEDFAVAAPKDARAAAEAMDSRREDNGFWVVNYDAHAAQPWALVHFVGDTPVAMSVERSGKLIVRRSPSSDAALAAMRRVARPLFAYKIWW